MDHYNSARAVAFDLEPDVPVMCLRPHIAGQQARIFTSSFDGTVFYAVKANPTPVLIEALWAGGVRHFDVASLREIETVVRQLPMATLALMHPVKSVQTIAKAYHDYGVRIFSLDSFEELEKIKLATHNAADLTLCVRLSVSNTYARLSLGSKFGCSAQDAPALLVSARQSANRLGVCFHVGSQTMNPASYRAAMEHASRLIVQAGVVVDIVDVGGGFPAPYPSMEPPALEAYFGCIHAAFEEMFVREEAELWCEPGRALVAPSASLIVKVDARKGDTLYINDGTYGALFDAGTPRWVFPTRLMRDHQGQKGETGYSFYGPTCDDIDFMQGPFMLPADVKVGDYIEIGMIGAYGSTMRTQFNGFDETISVIAEDSPLMALDLALAWARH